MASRRTSGPVYAIEHMEDGLEDWCKLEYKHVCQMVTPSRVHFFNFPAESAWSEELAPTPESTQPLSIPHSMKVAADAGQLPPWDRICLLDMDAADALKPEEASMFDMVVFGGILGNVTTNDDGSFGSDDRTSEIRIFNFAHRRHLGPMQMTTDTAVLVTRMVLEDGICLPEIPYLDSPDITADVEDGGDGEQQGISDSVCMEGFRYVARRAANGDWEPTLPNGMKELLMKDADNDILDSM